jgi:hypothetical protein
MSFDHGLLRLYTAFRDFPKCIGAIRSRFLRSLTLESDLSGSQGLKAKKPDWRKVADPASLISADSFEMQCVKLRGSG